MPDEITVKRLAWDEVGERFFETGVDRGVLYKQAADGTYPLGVAWNGLTSVNQNPSGAEATKLYANNHKYLNLLSAEEFGATIGAYTYPDEFAECDGSGIVGAGVTVGQQARKAFGFCYRTRIGNDVDGTEKGYKLHFVYGATAKPSPREYTTINDSPEAMSLSWEIETVPVEIDVEGFDFKPTATFEIDSTADLPDGYLEAVEDIIYGKDGVGAAATDPRLPLPKELIELYLDMQGE